MRGYLDWITQAEDIDPEGEERRHDEQKHGTYLALDDDDVIKCDGMIGRRVVQARSK